ncbi:MAG: nitroreductase family protein [Acidobacteria bacterium]|nr:nitroreductase family protein [Acidobacteriota bacterium]
MDFFELMQKRRSVRSFKSDPIPQELIDQILETIRISPSAGNVQPFRIKIVKDKETKEKLVKASFNQTFIAEAPIIIGFFALPSESGKHYGERGERLYSIQDATIALYSAHLAVDALGLGSCWIGAFNDGQVCEAFKVDSKKYIPVGFLPIGYPNEEPKKKKRKKLEELILI